MKFESGMQVVIVGSGSALPDPVRGNPSQAVVIDGEVLLFDCGERATVNLTLSGINPVDVDTLFLTHLHWDHMVDYNYLLMTTWNSGKDNTLNVYGPPGTQEMHDAFLKAHAVDVEFVAPGAIAVTKWVDQNSVGFPRLSRFFPVVAKREIVTGTSPATDRMQRVVSVNQQCGVGVRTGLTFTRWRTWGAEHLRTGPTMCCTIGLKRPGVLEVVVVRTDYDVQVAL